ncbi:putative transcription factor [Thermochaetoides thermophila DSM 1495]|uniref:Putative transcription factor n=1 Tax=Chaetomium thermophilum (strain DSM 1495 / CBS 144.50 / IMI 039719) TaxID=759272 RepID=G0SF79_CHATD|nr:putative transcription factor [Thermochaetoides thermophila DSM 1495]EGS18095.1 putative transcription factor [Thermochaetoides thermophila DSM 1495]
MPPRRSHKKSRTGCRRCKTRKIKCDEVHPRCGNCVKHGVKCDFEYPEVLAELQAAQAASQSPSTPSAASGYASPAAGPSSARSTATPLCRPPPTPALSQTTPPGQRLLELRLMHHYTAMTCKTFTFTAPVTEDIWKITVPNLAFSGSQHLADAILAVAALHLRSMRPDDKEMVRASHAYMAASLSEYSAALTKGIDHTNAEALFLTAALIAFQSTATRVFSKDEPQVGSEESDKRGPSGCYTIPFSWFHSFQGVKAITAASWQYLRVSPVVTQVINSQAALQLDFRTGPETFFGHLLEGMEEELAAMASEYSSANTDSTNDQQPQHPPRKRRPPPPNSLPQLGAPLAFPATVSRRYIELLEERRPRALAILACFFALLKSLDSVWWLQGMARREVLGVVSLFNSDYFGPDAYRTWWPHLEWAMRIALWEPPPGSQPTPDSPPGGVVIPPEIWGADWYAEEQALARGQAQHGGYVRHIELLSQMSSALQSFPPIVDYIGMENPEG